MGSRAAVLALLIVAGGCQDVTGPVALPGDLVLPPPSASLDPDSIVVGSLLASTCGIYRPDLVASGGAAFVDVFFLDGDMRPEPTAATDAWVRQHGGVVVHRYNAHAVRAAIYLDQVPALAGMEGVFVEVRSVPDAARYDVPVIVAFDGLVTLSEPGRFEQLGGRVDWLVGTRMAGVIPDRSIPSLRGLSRLRYVALSATLCDG